MNKTLRCAASVVLVLLANQASARDELSIPASVRYAAVKARIDAKEWAAAIAELERLNDTRSADWNNLMGYSSRKRRPPDLAAAERFYDTALRIDPAHRGALEYSGELYLMLDNPAKAEERRAALVRLCSAPCEELDDLDKAIARYKAAGNKYVPDE